LCWCLTVTFHTLLSWAYARHRSCGCGDLANEEERAGKKAQREAAGPTQEQLAKLMGYSPSVIAKLETCRTFPSPRTRNRPTRR
jgi:predicted transcriptional regulator